MAGIIAVYALVIAVLIAQDLNPPSQANYSLFKYVPARPEPSHLLLSRTKPKPISFFFFIGGREKAVLAA